MSSSITPMTEDANLFDLENVAALRFNLINSYRNFSIMLICITKKTSQGTHQVKRKSK